MFVATRSSTTIIPAHNNPQFLEPLISVNFQVADNEKRPANHAEIVVHFVNEIIQRELSQWACVVSRRLIFKVMQTTI